MPLHGLVSVTGHDGSGKSTLCKGLNALGHQTSSIHEFLRRSALSHSQIERGLAGYSQLAEHDALTRANLFCSVMRDWLEECQSQLSVHGRLIVDSYVIRYALKETIHNPEGSSAIALLLDDLPCPEYSLHVNLSCLNAYKRKSSHHWSDFWHDKLNSFDGFEKLQLSVEEGVNQWLAVHGSKSFEVDGNMSSEQVLIQSHELLTSLV